MPSLIELRILVVRDQKVWDVWSSVIRTVSPCWIRCFLPLTRLQQSLVQRVRRSKVLLVL